MNSQWTHAVADREQLRGLCVAAARQVGALLVELRRQDDVTVISTKSSKTDIVTNADNAAEELLRSILLGTRPNDAWLGEETGTTRGRPGSGQVRWIVDPIDGTVNYLYGLPGWSVSVAAEIDGDVVAGAVVIPTLGEEFSAAAAGGASRDGAPLAVSTCDRLDEALIATGFSYDAKVRTRQGKVAARLLPQVRDIRRSGAASVDFCALAAGRVDAYYETGLAPWDRAAGALIASEAGATVLQSEAGDVVAAGPVLLPKLLALLDGCGD